LRIGLIPRVERREGNVAGDVPFPLSIEETDATKRGGTRWELPRLETNGRYGEGFEMEQIISVVAGGALFLSFVADLEVRHHLQTSDYRGSARQIRVWGLTAGALVMAMAGLICLLLGMEG